MRNYLESAAVAGQRGRPQRIGLLLAAAILAGFAWTAASLPAAAGSAAMLLDSRSGEPLYAYEPDTPHRPASLTKMMTLYMAFEAMREGRLKPGQRLVVSRRASHQRPSRLGLARGRTIAIEDAVLALITKSANDAAVVIAESLGKTEAGFAAAMTERAHRLGMTQTQFRNASGLHHRDQWTTARDMARLALALIRDFPEEYRYFSTATFRWRGRRYDNHNALLSSYEGADGIKTGYIRQSGFNLVASAERDGRRLVGVVLGGETSDLRDWRMTALFDYGFALPRGGDATGDDATESDDLPRLAYRTDETADAVLTGIVERVEPAAPDGDTPQAATGVATVEPSGGDVWSIQVGAYGTAAPAEEAALKAAERLPALASGATLAVIPVDRDGERFYRARLVGLTQENARAACRKLTGQRIPCLAITTPSTSLALNVSQ